MNSTDDPLVSTDWLSARIDDPKVKIIDASFKLPGVLPLPVDDYLAGHIPGAVYFDVDAIADHDDPRPHMSPDAATLPRSAFPPAIPWSPMIPAAGSPHRGRGGCFCRSATAM
jgi:3-mercaptopyruvate sulfurtransferase SseA